MATTSVREAARAQKHEYEGGHEDRPLAGYLVLLGSYLAAAATVAGLLRHRRRPVPSRVDLSDLLLVGVATHKVSRILAKEPITSPLRAPFTRYEGPAGPAELHEEARGRGVRHAVGELVSCPFCLSQWTATTFVTGLVVAPRGTRLAASVFAATTISDALQFVYARLQDTG